MEHRAVLDPSDGSPRPGLTDLADPPPGGSCSSCCDTGSVVDADTGVASPCGSCRPTASVPTHAHRTTSEIAVVASSEVGALVGHELAESDGSCLSPIASLALLALSYREAEREFRRLDSQLDPILHQYEASVEDVVLAEVELLRAISPGGTEPSDLDFLEALHNRVGLGSAVRDCVAPLLSDPDRRSARSRDRARRQLDRLGISR